MKRKKPPIALISVLVVALLGLVVIGPGFAFFNKSAKDQQEELQKQAMDRMKSQANKPSDGKVDAGKEVGAMKNEMKKSKSGLAPQRPSLDENGDPSKKATSPTVLMPSDEIQKPKPNTAAPSSQWYGGK